MISRLSKRGTRYTIGSERDTADTVREYVLERLMILAPGGGFLFNTIHNILPDAPPENIVAMFAALEEYHTAGS